MIKIRFEPLSFFRNFRLKTHISAEWYPRPSDHGDLYSNKHLYEHMT